MGTVDPKSRGVVLIVEDDQDLRALVRDLLESQRYFVLEADDGRDALYTLRLGEAPAVSLIVLDLALPCISGWELLDILRADPGLSHIPVLVASGLPVHGDASGIGATMSWLRKPYGEEALLAAVGEAIEATRAGRRADANVTERNARKPSPSHPDG
jgi:CheY-like chemotaxis protein